ncbi:MAG TPA: hypothetical protein PKX74_05915 [Leptospiraceae bacterium]|nr:hypothetical protein [Leptospirales bacterium]HMY44991.1 hypothetical protein [Leptospiraceae bacterium]HNE22273.1 hypothetical protein [Leptospiraceae bacterium]HNL01450.1 hypothetical protein [Leptospiraceae bacterium]HNN73469.1 hypothetical protein [Leptospiraceae bacterium]
MAGLACLPSLEEMRLLAPFFAFVLAASCAWMGEDGLTAIRGQKVITRKETQGRLREAIIINMAKCPENVNAGLYGEDYIVPGEVTHTHYYEESVNNCVVAILAVSCGLNPSQNIVILANFYRTVIRLCNLKPATG